MKLVFSGTLEWDTRVNVKIWGTASNFHFSKGGIEDIALFLWVYDRSINSLLRIFTLVKFFFLILVWCFVHIHFPASMFVGLKWHIYCQEPIKACVTEISIGFWFVCLNFNYMFLLFFFKSQLFHYFHWLLALVLKSHNRYKKCHRWIFLTIVTTMASEIKESLKHKTAAKYLQKDNLEFIPNHAIFLSN